MAFEEERRQLVDLLAGAGDRQQIADRRVLDVMGRVPRHLFVPEDQLPHAYEDRALPIGEGQTISQPYVVASMTEALQINDRHRVLEIGTGCGYQAAVLAEMASEVFSIEYIEELGSTARQRLDALGYTNIHFRIGDGSLGWPEHAPFDRIILTCRTEEPPAPLLQQLSSNGGRMLAPLGGPEQQDLVLLERNGNTVRRETLYPVRFVPML